jgi:hypothetical protein
MKADKQSPPSGESGIPKDMVSICLLKRQNFLSVTIQITFDAIDDDQIVHSNLYLN